MEMRKLGWASALAVVMACGPAALAETYDVVIAGAGSGGTAAAIQAARMGMRVALLEETEYIGGQMGAAAVSNMDEGFRLTPPSGFYREFLANMEAYYLRRGQTIGTCYWTAESHCFEPVGVRRVLESMIEETNRTAAPNGHVTLMLRERVTAVHHKDKLVTGVQTLHHGNLDSRILIDATEWGDVIPLTPARFRVGNQVGTPTHNSCIQDITYTMVLKKYPNGVPAELQMKTPPPDYDKYVEAWRLNLRKDGNPDDRWLPVSFAQHNAYRGMPDPGSTSYVSTQSRAITKTGLNWFNDSRADVGIFDRAHRQQYVCAAKLKSLGNLYYIQHELGETQWSIANDQEFDTAYQREDNLCPNIPAEYKAIERNMPQSPYVRESRRIIGKHKLVASEIRRESQGAVAIKRFPSSIAVGDYADDLHKCSAEEDLELDLEHKSDDPPGFRSGPFQVPFGALIPEEVDGMLVAEKNLSVSRLANGAIRLQPITMLTGQAAGALAALSVNQGIAPRAVNWSQLQTVLLDVGSILASPPMKDMPQGTTAWQAAQFAVTHQWMETGKDAQFHPERALTRAEAVTVIASAYELANRPGVFGPTPSRLSSSFSDVPLYSETSAPAEALKAAGVPVQCGAGANRLCPADSMLRGDFLQMIAALEARKPGGPTSDELRSQTGVAMQEPITRGEAALVLYAAMRHRLPAAVPSSVTHSTSLAAQR